jgi:hypothetical protein
MIDPGHPRLSIVRQSTASMASWSVVKIFLHPDVRAYDRSHESEALKWIVR